MIKKLLKQVTELMNPYPVYLVGGAVRDYLMENEPKDYDFCTPTEPDEIERLIKASGKRAYLTGKRFGTLGCKIDGQMIEITTFRTEEYESGNRKPKVKYVKNIHEDLSRRDFTINAIAIRLTKNDNLRVIDPFCGEEDIENKIIRSVGTPKQRFKEDPLRILRAIRFACRFDFKIEETTKKKMQRMAICILDISKERWMMELDKILLSDNVDIGISELFICNLFKYMIPELSLQWAYDQNSEYHVFDLCTHTINVIRETPKDINLRWAALLHDIAKPFVRVDKDIILTSQKFQQNFGTKSNYVGHEILGAEMVDKIAIHLKWSKDRREKVVNLVKNHLRDDCPLREYDNRCKKGVENVSIN